jgi:serine/threonine protein kinase
MWFATQMISRIETMHNAGIIHRDIKPDNFLIGHSKKVNNLFVIDFGISKRFISHKTGKHIESRKKGFVCGTPLFISKNAHRGYE